MTTFFTGCTHFDHENIIRLANRPFNDVDEMNEELVRRWNAVVKENDTVYHLGDFGWKPGRIYDWRRRLNGQVKFALGNHDEVREFNFAGFVHENYYSLSLKPSPEESKKQVVLFHYPIQDWDGKFRGSIHLHCHTHSPHLRNPALPLIAESGLDMGDSAQVLPSRYPAEQTCNRFNVGVDACAFAPISWEEIIAESKRHG